MAIIKFMCGMRLDSPSPQSFSMCVDQQMMATSLPKSGIAQTRYSVHIADIKTPIFDAFSKNLVLSLSKFSKIIKLRQKTRVASKWLNSLRDAISNTSNFLKGSGQQPLTQASFCKNVYAGSYYLDKRVRMLVPRIINMISRMDTCQLEWENLPENEKTKRLQFQKTTYCRRSISPSTSCQKVSTQTNKYHQGCHCSSHMICSRFW